MSPVRAGLFGLLSVAAGACAYLTAAYYIEATSHTVPIEPPFYLFGVGLLLAFAGALKVAWPAWRGWAVPAALILMAATFFILYMRFFLPFP